jgi:hypothetical protein
VRRQAAALFASGSSPVEVAARLEVSTKSARVAVGLARGALTSKGPSGPPSKLRPQQLPQLERLLEAGPPRRASPRISGGPWPDDWSVGLTGPPAGGRTDQDRSRRAVASRGPHPSHSGDQPTTEPGQPMGTFRTTSTCSPVKDGSGSSSTASGGGPGRRPVAGRAGAVQILVSGARAVSAVAARRHLGAGAECVAGTDRRGRADLLGCQRGLLIARAHRHAAGARKRGTCRPSRPAGCQEPADHALGRSRGGRPAGAGIRQASGVPPGRKAGRRPLTRLDLAVEPRRDEVPAFRVITGWRLDPTELEAAVRRFAPGRARRERWLPAFTAGAVPVAT